MQKHLFISYSRVDSMFVDSLVDKLISIGLPIWIDRNNLSTPSQQWNADVRSAIKDSFAILLIASPASQMSTNVQGEISIAQKSRCPIIVVWAEGEDWQDCVPISLINSQYLDVRGEKYQSLLPRLISEIYQAQKNHHMVNEIDSVSNNPLMTIDSSITSRHVVKVLIFYASMVDDEEIHSLPFINTLVSSPSIKITEAKISSLYDAVQYLSNSEYEIINFIGFRIYSDDVNKDMLKKYPSMLSASAFYNILKPMLPSQVRLLIISSPFCADGSKVLSECTPYFISVESEEQVRNLFLQSFYNSYLQNLSIERSYVQGKVYAQSSNNIANAVFSIVNRESLVQIGVFPIEIPGFPDIIIINISEVIPIIYDLGFTSSKVIDIITRKMKAHYAMFQKPRENAMLPIDSLFIGIFSWNAYDGYIRCNEILKLPNNINPIHWREWCRLLVAYNSLYSEEYRTLLLPSSPIAKHVLSRGLHIFEKNYQSLKDCVAKLVALGFNSVEYPFDLGFANLEQARIRFSVEDLGGTVASLESALTYLHTALDSVNPAK